MVGLRGVLLMLMCCVIGVFLSNVVIMVCSGSMLLVFMKWGDVVGLVVCNFVVVSVWFRWCVMVWLVLINVR